MALPKLPRRGRGGGLFSGGGPRTATRASLTVPPSVPKMARLGAPVSLPTSDPQLRKNCKCLPLLPLFPFLPLLLLFLPLLLLLSLFSSSYRVSMTWSTT